jgi:hypothetical protein
MAARWLLSRDSCEAKRSLSPTPAELLDGGSALTLAQQLIATQQWTISHTQVSHQQGMDRGEVHTSDVHVVAECGSNRRWSASVRGSEDASLGHAAQRQVRYDQPALSAAVNAGRSAGGRGVVVLSL